MLWIKVINSLKSPLLLFVVSLLNQELLIIKLNIFIYFKFIDIYGLTTEDNLCAICCVNPRNTFFLPCKHSYTCQECAILIRAKDDKCPICREKIKDSVILTNVNANPENLNNENQEGNNLNYNNNNNANQSYPVPEN